MNENFTLPENANVHLDKHVKILATKHKCRGCDTNVRKYIDTTPDEILAKYLCNCRDKVTDELTGPQFPLFEAR